MKLLPQDVNNKVNCCLSEAKQNNYDYKSLKNTDTEIEIKSDYGKSGDLNLQAQIKFYRGCIMLMFANVLLSCFMLSYGIYLSSGQALLYSDLNILKKQFIISMEPEIQYTENIKTLLDSMIKTILEQCNETAVNKSKEVLNSEWRNIHESDDGNLPTKKTSVFQSLENPLRQINESQYNATMQHPLKNLSSELQDNFKSNENYNTSFNPVDTEQISDEIEDSKNTTNVAIPIHNFNTYGDASLRSEDPSRLRRPKRSNRRGKEPERRPSNGGGVRQRKKKQLRAPEAIHFKGGQPEIFVRDGGLVAPWFYNDATSSNFTLKTVQLKQGKGAVEVSEDALYLIYSQVYYLTSNAINSYTLNLKHGTQPNSTVLAYCSAVAPNGSLNEISCYTSVVQFLKAEDRIFIQQRDMNRRIILRDGYSFLGIVRLSG